MDPKKEGGQKIEAEWLRNWEQKEGRNREVWVCAGLGEYEIRCKGLEVAL